MKKAKKPVKKTAKKKEVVSPNLKQELPPVGAEAVIIALKSLMASSGWAEIKRILNENIKYIEACILDRRDPLTRDDIQEADIEILRLKRSLNIDLRDTPENYLKLLEEEGEVPENYDPYFKTVDEIKSRNKG